MSIAVDLDGTLAHYDKWRGLDHIGPPIFKMAERVFKWNDEGKEVVILTARVTTNGQSQADANYAQLVIRQWVDKHNLPIKRITAQKDFTMTEIWDDRAMQVIPNTGRHVLDAD